MISICLFSSVLWVMSLNHLVLGSQKGPSPIKLPNFLIRKLHIDRYKYRYLFKFKNLKAHIFLISKSIYAVLDTLFVINTVICCSSSYISLDAHFVCFYSSFSVLVVLFCFCQFEVQVWLMEYFKWQQSHSWGKGSFPLLAIE